MTASASSDPGPPCRARNAGQQSQVTETVSPEENDTEPLPGAVQGVSRSKAVTWTVVRDGRWPLPPALTFVLVPVMRQSTGPSSASTGIEQRSQDTTWQPDTSSRPWCCGGEGGPGRRVRERVGPGVAGVLDGKAFSVVSALVGLGSGDAVGPAAEGPGSAATGGSPALLPWPSCGRNR